MDGLLRIEGAGIGINITYGGRMAMAGLTPVFSGVTNELQIDGTNYTFAALVAAGPPAVLSSPFFSIAIR